MFLLTVRKSKDGSKVVAVCEKKLVGKMFEDGDLVLDLRGNFFFEEGLTVETDDFDRIADEVKKSFTSKIVGNEIVSRFIKAGIIDRSNVKEICGIKYAMTFRI